MNDTNRLQATEGVAMVEVRRRLEASAHGLMALYLISVLAVPSTSTLLPALACLAAIIAGLPHWRADARAGFSYMAILIVPAGVYLTLLSLQMINGTAPIRLGSHVLAGLFSVAVGLSGVPNRVADVRRWLLPAAAIGAIATCGLALYQVWALGYLRPYGWLGAGPQGNGAIKFGDLAAVQGLLSLVLVLTAVARWRRVLGLAGLFAGTLALALTQTRGGLLGFVLAVGVLGLALGLQHLRKAAAAGDDVTRPNVRARRGKPLMLVVLALILMVSAGAFMQDRFAQIEPQVQRYLKGDVISEVGQRLVLWHAALRAGQREPVSGVGFGRFAAELDRQVASGEVPASEQLLYHQTHSEYLAAFAEAGVPGLLSLGLMFIAPVFALIWRIRSGRGSPAAYAALVTAAAFSGFALTDDMFDRQITVIAFFFLNTWFLRAAFDGATPRVLPEAAGGEQGTRPRSGTAP